MTMSQERLFSYETSEIRKMPEYVESVFTWTNINNVMLYRNNFATTKCIKIGNRPIKKHLIVEHYIIKFQADSKELEFIIYDKSNPLIRIGYNDYDKERYYYAPEMAGYIDDPTVYAHIVAKLDEMYRAKFTQGLHNRVAQFTTIRITAHLPRNESERTTGIYNYRFDEYENIAGNMISIVSTPTRKERSSSRRYKSSSAAQIIAFTNVINDATTNQTKFTYKVHKKNPESKYFAMTYSFKNIKLDNLFKYTAVTDKSEMSTDMILGHNIVETYYIKGNESGATRSLYIHICDKLKPAVFIFYHNGTTEHDNTLLQSYIVKPSECLAIAETFAEIFATKYTKGLTHTIKSIVDITITAQVNMVTEHDLDMLSEKVLPESKDIVAKVPLSALKYVSCASDYNGVYTDSEYAYNEYDFYFYLDNHYDSTEYDIYDDHGMYNDGLFINYERRNDKIEKITVVRKYPKGLTDKRLRDIKMIAETHGKNLDTVMDAYYRQNLGVLI